MYPFFLMIIKAFLGKKMFFLLRKTFFLLRNIIFLLRKMIFLVRIIIFLPRKTFFLLRKIVFLLRKIIFLVRIIIFLPRKIVFLLRKMFILGKKTPNLHNFYSISGCNDIKPTGNGLKLISKKKIEITNELFLGETAAKLIATYSFIILKIKLWLLFRHIQSSTALLTQKKGA